MPGLRTKIDIQIKMSSKIFHMNFVAVGSFLASTIYAEDSVQWTPSIVCTILYVKIELQTDAVEKICFRI